MKIYDFRFKLTESHALVEAKIQCNILPNPVDVWFKTDIQHKNFIYPTADVFALSVLPVAMYLREDLEIDAPLTDEVLSHLHKCVSLLSSWPKTDLWPGLLPIKISSSTIKKWEPIKKLQNRAAFFSLGLDSFFTLQESEKNSKTRVSHLILGWGFDIRNENKELFNEVRENAQIVANKTDKELLILETNINNGFTGLLMNWELVHGFVLAGVGYFFGRGLEEVFINTEDAMISGAPYGVHSDLEPLWSTEVVKILLFGTGYKRSEKTKIIRNNELAQKYLRVCWENRNNKYNCSQCPKCLRTMLQLRSIGTLEKFTVFSQQIPIQTFKTMIEPKHRFFIWWDLLKTLPFQDFNYRFAIVKMLYRSHLNLTSQFMRKVKRNVKSSILILFEKG